MVPPRLNAPIERSLSSGIEATDIATRPSFTKTSIEPRSSQDLELDLFIDGFQWRGMAAARRRVPFEPSKVIGTPRITSLIEPGEGGGLDLGREIKSSTFDMRYCGNSIHPFL